MRTIPRTVRLLLLVPLLEMASPLTAQTVELLGQATVDGPQVTLSQVARVTGTPSAPADAIAALALQAAPPVGASETLSLSALRDRLDELGVNRAVWTLCGASACRISRVEGPAQQIEQLQRHSAQLRAGLSGPVVTAPEHAIPDSLAGCVRKLMLDHFEPPGGRLALQFDLADRSLLSLRRPDFRFDLAIKRVGERYVDLAVQIYAVQTGRADQPAAGDDAASAGLADQLVKSGDLRVRAELSAPVVVARRPINRGQVLTAEDVQLSLRPVGLTSPASRDLAAVVGQQARRMIRAEETIEPTDLAPLALVHRNKLVTVWSRSGNTLIRTAGRAMQDGVYGERVLVRNEQSLQPFYGIVSGPDTVELDPTPVQETRRGGSAPAQSSAGGRTGSDGRIAAAGAEGQAP